MSTENRDRVRRALREFRKYEGDGQGGTGALPIGDPSSGAHNPPKSLLREALEPVALGLDQVNASVDASAASATASANSATNAATSEANAAASATNAANSEDGAEIAASAIAANADLYDDTASGLAATVDGDLFFVPGTNTIIVYRNDDGVATELTTFGGFTQSGVGAVARTVDAKLKESVTADDFRLGDDPDDTNAWQRAVAAHACVKGVPGKTYVISGQIVITRNDTVIDLRGVIVNASGFRDVTEINSPDGLFHVQGTERLSTTLAASPAKDATTLTLTSAAGVEAGDAIYLLAAGTSTQRWYTEGATVVRRSIVSKVVSVSGSTVTIQDPLPFDFDISAGAVNVSIWRGVRNVDFLGGRIIGPGYVTARTNGLGEAGITSEYAQNVRVHGTSVEGMQGAVGWFARTHGFSWIGGDHIGRPIDYQAAIVEGDTAGFTGIWGFEAAAGFLKNMRGSRLRHLVDGTRTPGVIVADCHAFDCHRAPYTTHSGCTDWVFQNCNYKGDNGGILWRGFDVTVIGGNIDCPNDTEAAFYDTAGNVADLGKTIKLIGFRGSAQREAVLLEGNIKYCLINGCELVGARAPGYHPVNINSLHLKHLEITGGRIETVIGGDVIRGVNNTPTTRASIIVRGVNLVGYTSASAGRAVRIFSGGSTTIKNLVVEGCTLEPSGSYATADHVRVDGTVDVLVTGPNYFNGALFWPREVWSPTTHYTVGDGSTNATLAGDTISVRRQGSFIHIAGRIRTTNLTGVTGNIQLNLPVTIAQPCGGEIHVATGLNLAASGQRITLRGLTGHNYLTFHVWNGTAGSALMGASVLTASADLFFTATLVI